MKKPATCAGCALFYKGFGYAPAVGPANSKILLVGEALGAQEAITGKPFIGQAGAMLDRILRLCGFSREQFRIDNTIRCQPPNNWLAGAPWEHEAVEHCSQYINATLAEQHTVVMPLGAVAARRLLNLPPGKGKMQDLHGTVSRDHLDRFWIVPSFHPSYIQRGAHNLIGVVVYDFKLAAEIALKGRVPDPGKLTVDPSIQWFGEWADSAFRYASSVVATGGKPPWLSIDIETPEKARGLDEDELKSGRSTVLDIGDLPTLADVEKPAALKDKKNVILRINFSYERDHGITVPFYGGYVDIIRQLCASPLFSKAFWNISYDRPRLEINQCPVAEPAFDIMDAWHMLQSDVPRGLGFVGPFYSTWGPWKHLSDEKPGEYAAIDALQTIRIAEGVEIDLKKLGMWDTYYRHMYKLDTLALRPAEEVGLLVDPGDKEKEEGGLYGFRKLLEDKKTEIVGTIRTHVPESLRPIEKIYKTRRAITDENDQLLPELAPKLEEYKESELKSKCSKCGTVGVRKGHEKTKKCLGAEISLVEIEVPRWRLWGEFNPSSSQQMLAYIRHRGHEPGKQKKTKADSSDASALEALAKKHKNDPVYPLCLDLRKVDKMKGTYADGMLKRMDEHNRVHTTFTHKPSTLRLSSGDPNLQNLVKRGDDQTEYAKQFRRCVVAGPGNLLIEADYAGIEAVEVGWFSADPNYIRLATMGVHSFLCSHLLNNPADLSWDDQKLGEFLSQFKKSKDPKVKELYARAKRCVHGTNYGMTPPGMHANYPDTFKTVKDAEKVHSLYMAVCPKLHEWQKSLIQRAHRYGYLGGDEHPFKYRHWFWNVINHKRLSKSEFLTAQRRGTQVIENDTGYWSVQYGEDAKRAIAFFPQSTAGGILKETMLHLFDPEIPEAYIGDAYYGKTPLRMPIHDSLVLEVPQEKADYVLERLIKVMSSPVKQQPCPESWGIGQTDGIKIGIEVEMGSNWAEMKAVDIKQYGG